MVPLLKRGASEKLKLYLTLNRTFVVFGTYTFYLYFLCSFYFLWTLYIKVRYMHPHSIANLYSFLLELNTLDATIASSLHT